MQSAAKKTRYFLDIDPGLRNQVKAAAALRGQTMREWLTEAIVAKLEDEIDAAGAESSMADTEGTMSFRAYLESRGLRPDVAE